MARPAKATSTMAKHLTEEERRIREAEERKLRGMKDKIHPPDYLSERQAEIFWYIVDELSEAGILGNLDVYILSQAAVSIDRLQQMEEEINREPGLLRVSAYMSAKNQYSRDFFRCCNELSLSPQSRAKLAGLKAQKEKGKSPLLLALQGEEDDDE